MLALYDGNVFLKVRADVRGIRPDSRTHLQAGVLSLERAINSAGLDENR
jgi:hypothetical protein